MDEKGTASFNEQIFPASYTVQAATYSRAGDSVKLTLSSDETLVLPSDTYALLKIGEGGVLEREELLRLKKIEAVHIARQKGLRLLERRAFTAAQLKARLGEELFPKEVVEEVLKDFSARGYVNDEKYGEAWIAAQLKRKPQGRRLLYLGLVRKGIGRKQADRLLTEAYPQEREEEICEKLLEKLADGRGSDGARLLNALARRGFGIPLIKKVYKRFKGRE
jgi:regulatory protein